MNSTKILQVQATPGGLLDTLLIVDKTGMIIELSGSYASIFGYRREELLKQRVECLLPGIKCDELIVGLGQQLHDEQQVVLGAELKVLHHDGSPSIVKAELSEIELNGNNYYLILLRDRSQQVSTNNIVDRLGRILDASWEEVFVFEAESLNFIQVSKGAQHNLGYSLSDMLSLTPYDIKPSYSEAEFRALLLPLLNGDVNSLNMNTIHRRKDGTDYAVDIRLQYAQNENPPVFVALVKDITEEQHIQRRLQESEQRLSLHVQQTPLGVIDWNMNFEVMTWNPAAERIFGYTCEEALGKHAAGLVIPVSARMHVDKIWQALLTQEGGLQSTNQNITKDGQEIMCEWYNTPLIDDAGHVVGVSSLVQDITERTRAENKLSYQASHDVLTGLTNRREFEVQLRACLESAKEHNYEHALLYLDLDQFKVVNDTCGHVAGDELLKQLSSVMSSHLRAADTFARLGGDEFGVLLVKCPEKNARIVADMLRQTVKDFRFIWQERIFELSVSIGIASITAESENEADLLSAADVACYTAKEKGRNRIHIYVTHDEELVKRHGEMHRVSDINSALKEDRLSLYVQEILPLSAARKNVSHFEVLVRMTAEDGTLLLPGAFLPAAERYNLMPGIDQWVIDRAFKYLSLGLPVEKWTEQSSLMINLSGHSLNAPDFLGYVQNKLDEYQIQPDRICFEITETVAVANLSSTIKLINVLKGKGCEFALDDFGSGVSSFSYLKNLPVDYLKIDGEFVKDMTEDSVDYAMVETINKIGHLMGNRTIAEYAESEQILNSLKKIGVDYAQGYAIGHPFPLKD